MDFVNRLKFFMDSHNIAISQFADTCRIPRPTLSQILNGRNKKISDELIAKIHAAYPLLSVLWLMFGEGEMETQPNTLFSEPQKGAFDHYQQTYPAAAQTVASQQTSISDPQQKESEKSDSPMKADYTAEGDQPMLDLAAEWEDPAPYGLPPTQPSDDPTSRNYESQSIHFYNAPAAPGRPYTSAPAAAGRPAPYNVPDNSAPSPAGEENATDAAANDEQTADNALHTSIPLTGGGCLSVDSPAGKKITNIVVFYSDNSFQSFSPSV